MKIPYFLFLLAFVFVACSSPKVDVNECARKADSCYFAGDYQGATEWYTHALKSQDAEPRHYYNAACCATAAEQYDEAIQLLQSLQKKNKQWYSRKLEVDADLEKLHNVNRWDKVVSVNRQRKEVDETRFEHPLYEQLWAIQEEDQHFRNEYVQAMFSGNKEKQDSILPLMLAADTVHMQFIDSLITARGWVGKDAIGDANATIWVVVQHYGLDMWKKYLPIFQAAAEQGELDKGAVAMLEDRILTTEGKPQRYGSQCYWDGERNHIAPLEDTLHIDSLRASVGMCSIAEYAKQMGAEWD